MDEENLNSFREERLNLRQRKPIIFTSIAVGTVLAVVVGVSTFGKYITFSNGKNLDELPVIKADQGSYGFVPTNPGGLDIPNRDKYIYESLRDKKFKDVERLLEPEEKPILTDDFETLSENENDKLLNKSEKDTTQVEVLFKNEENLEKQEKTEKKISEKIDNSTKITETKLEKKEVLADNKEVFFIQFASVRSEDLANSEMKRLERKYVDLFKGLKSEISKTETEKGVFFRIKAGVFDSKEKAKDLCQKFKEKKQECIIVK